MSKIMERRRSKENLPEAEPFDPYFDMFGVRMTIEDLIDIRDAEDDLIELEHITEDDRYPVPYYLSAEWADYVTSTYGKM